MELKKEKSRLEEISYHLLIHNYSEASKVASQSIKEFPLSSEIRELYIKALALLGDEKKLLQNWQRFSRDFPENKYKESVLENLSWGVIHKATRSDNLYTKFNALVASGSNPDSASVLVIKEMLQDSNSLIREIALDFTLKFGDDTLKDEILRLLEQEPTFNVRKKAIEVCYRMKIQESKPQLEKLLIDESVTNEEKFMITQALLFFVNDISHDELKKLVEDKRMGQRLLACQLFLHLDLKEELSLLKELLFDSQKDVRLAALHVLGILRIGEINDVSVNEILKDTIGDPDPQIALMAHWILSFFHPDQHLSKLRDFLFFEDQTIRLFATALINYSMPYTLPIAKEFIHTHTDSFVRANLAYGLANQRLLEESACKELNAFLAESKTFIFKEYYPSRVYVISPIEIANYKTSEFFSLNYSSILYQVAQLEILNLLSVLDDPKAIDGISKFLETYHSDVTIFAVKALLDTENKEAFDFIKGFLSHPDNQKRLEAALVLAAFKHDKEALFVLQQTYPNVNRRLRQIILMAIGEIGDKESVPFLIDKMYEPSQFLRVNAASALIQCINH